MPEPGIEPAPRPTAAAMRIAVLTDLHAILEAVQATFAHAEAQGAERYALLGDFVGYGADPAAVVTLVRERVAAGALAVKGNHDAAVVRGASPSMRPDARFVIDWTRSRLDADAPCHANGVGPGVADVTRCAMPCERCRGWRCRRDPMRPTGWSMGP